VQERLTCQIADTLMAKLNPRGVASRCQPSSDLLLTRG